MTIHVQLFARARDLARSDMLDVKLPARATVADLRRLLGETCPALRDFLPRCAIAVNEDFADDDAPVPAGASVAVIPPVSGGDGRPKPRKTRNTPK